MTNVPSKPATLVAAVVLTCLVAAAGLAATYALTKDAIAEQDIKAQKVSLEAAVPSAADFNQVTDERMLAAAAEVAGEVQVNGVFEAVNAEGAVIGWGLRLGSRGYGGFAQLVIGLDTSGKATGVSILSHGETPGLGTKVMANPEYLEQFTSLEEGFTAKDVRGIDAIAGATKSSNSVKNALSAASAIYAEVLSKEGE